MPIFVGPLFVKSLLNLFSHTGAMSYRSYCLFPEVFPTNQPFPVLKKDSWPIYFSFSHTEKTVKKKGTKLTCLSSSVSSRFLRVLWVLLFYAHQLILECLFSFSPSALGLTLFPFCFFHMLLLTKKVSVSRYFLTNSIS